MQSSNGRLVSIWCDLVSKPESLIDMTECPIDFSPGRLLELIAKMNPYKGLGPDCVPADLLAAGGSPIALHLSNLARGNDGQRLAQLSLGFVRKL